MQYILDISQNMCVRVPKGFCHNCFIQHNHGILHSNILEGWRSSCLLSRVRLFASYVFSNCSSLQASRVKNFLFACWTRGRGVQVEDNQVVDALFPGWQYFFCRTFRLASNFCLEVKSCVMSAVHHLVPVILKSQTVWNSADDTQQREGLTGRRKPGWRGLVPA